MSLAASPQVVHINYDPNSNVMGKPIQQLIWAHLKDPFEASSAQMNAIFSKLRQHYGKTGFGGPTVEDPSLYCWVLGVDTIEVCQLPVPTSCYLLIL